MLTKPINPLFYDLIDHTDQGKLTKSDAGGIFVRCFPLKNGDHSYIPLNATRSEILRRVVTFSPPKKGDQFLFIRHFYNQGKPMHEEVSLPQDWNDGHWMNLAAYLNKFAKA